MLQTGYTLRNRYRVEAFLGRGGMADVYLAFDLKRRVRVAIKMLREDFAEDKEFVRRFQREAEALARLDHPYIVRFYSFERQGLLAFIVMDYVVGKTLRRRIAEVDGPLPLDEVTRILDNVGSALQYAHNEGFIHRDIKPGNIMLRHDGSAVLTDFGIARAAEATTLTMGQIGTPAYMSPEQILGHKLDYRTDIYSLGVVLFEMVTGRRPFTAEEISIGTSTIDRIRYAHLHLPPPNPREFNSKLPNSAAEVILRSLAKQPQDRWPTVAAMVEAWEQAVGKPSRSSLSSALPYLTMVSQEEKQSPDRKNMGIRIFLLISMTAVVISLSVFAYIRISSSGKMNIAPSHAQRNAPTSMQRIATVSHTPFVPTQTAGISTSLSATASSTPTLTLTPTPTFTLTPTGTPTLTATPTATNTPTPFVLIPGREYPVHRSLMQDIFDGNNYLGKVLFEIESVYTAPTGKTITLNVYWMFLPDKKSDINKIQRINSPDEIWLIDNVGNRYSPLQLGGILSEDTAVLVANEKAEAWIVFPAPEPGVTRFTYHGDGETLTFSLVK